MHRRSHLIQWTYLRPPFMKITPKPVERRTISRPLSTVRTSFEVFEFLIFVDHSKRTQLLNFSDHHDAQQFLEGIMSDIRDPGLLRNLLRNARIQSPLSLLTDPPSSRSLGS